ncbi:MAG TPA: ABC transporter substrate-binding protein [Aestuariivirga sp.]|nr:ABC transporter substrate-binding protein [Aestuariivirga sp.]
MADTPARPLGRRKFLGLSLVGLFSPATVAWAAGSAAENYVRGIAEDVMALANSGQSGSGLRNRFATLLNRYINLRGVANYALGSYQNKLPGSKRSEFYRLVSNYAAGLFVFYVKDFRGSDLDIISSSTQGNFIIINSVIKGNGGGEQVRWRLSQTGNGFRVSDVNVKGVWLTIAMKDRFNRVLRQSNGDFEALFKSLREADHW